MYRITRHSQSDAEELIPESLRGELLSFASESGRSEGPEVYGLEYEVPVDQITSVQPRDGRSGRVDVQFRDATNARRSDD